VPPAFRPRPFEDLLRWVLGELEHNGSIFGIPREHFFRPRVDAPYATRVFGREVLTPVGPAAGPHTQLAPNIVCAWLCGARVIELKTVQILDRLEIPRPCIDMADEGYNVEWSQELSLQASATEYIKAWALIHILHRLLGYEGHAPVGTLFNMSVGYDLAGIQSGPVTRFMERLTDATAELDEIREVLKHAFPQFADVDIPAQICNSVTLSTMHGCPPDEIERIGRYLLEKRGLHTLIKLNPTLLGREEVLDILHGLGFREIPVPEEPFRQDLQYPEAVECIRRLQSVAAPRGLSFGVKLSNTLAVANHRGVLPGETIYLSGRPLYPIALELFRRLARDFSGGLLVSFSAGIDARNVATVLSCGARWVTVVTDLLKPGGYTRLGQYLEAIEAEMDRRGARTLDEFARDTLAQLEEAAVQARVDPRYRKDDHPCGLPKVDSPLERFDCIAAPCVAHCPLGQDVPRYAARIASGDADGALQAVLAHNPLPRITGLACPHPCERRCTRNVYEEPVAIRALKRFAAERGRVGIPPAARVGRRVAIVGGGPSGLAAAFFLACSGVEVTVFEAGEQAGGLPAIAPAFRVPREAVQADVARIAELGVEIRCGYPVAGPPERLLEEGYDAAYLACGLPRDARLGIPGEDGPGVYGALEWLRRVGRGERPVTGGQVLVIGGGNSAIDVARTARRLTGHPATVVYRRTQSEMPADPEEVAALLEEGNRLVELASPVQVLHHEGRCVALVCLRNRLGAPGPDGRPRPEALPGSEFELPADTVVLAVGQRPDPTLFQGSRMALRADGRVAVDPETGETSIPGVFAGGDIVRGPATIVEACADGRRAAEAICRRLGIPLRAPVPLPAALDRAALQRVGRMRARKESRREPGQLPLSAREGFAVVETVLDPQTAQEEASRCLQCSSRCDRCVDVCPNRANLAYRITPLRRRLPVLRCQEGQLVVAGWEEVAIVQERQILHLADWCNECGNCATFCVHVGHPYREKPRLFLEEAAFLREKDNALWLAGDLIRRREQGREMALWLDAGGFRFDDGRVRLRFSFEGELHESVLRAPFTGEISLRPALEMWLVLQGVRESFPFLPVTGAAGP
jgi:putative selenate reductase